MEHLIILAAGPASTIAAAFYVRLFITKALNGDSRVGVIGAGLCALVMCWLAGARAALALGVIDQDTYWHVNLPWVIPAYTVHIYMAERLTHLSQLRRALRKETQAAQVALGEALEKGQQ